MIQPEPAPDCRYDFNYNLGGRDWVCNCNIGLKQSPVWLPDPESLEPLKYNMQF